MSGARLIGIGVGPGDPELLTLKGLARLREAAVIAYPVLDSRPAFTRRVVAPHLVASQRELALEVPLVRAGADGNAATARTLAYDTAADTLAAELDAGNTTALLCEGDPLFYGSFIYLYERLAARGYPIEIVPGVSSITAAAARLGVPLACGDAPLVVLPGTMPPKTLHARLTQGGNFALLKPNRNWSELRAMLNELDATARVCCVSHATLDEEVLYPPGTPLPDSVPYFSIVLLSVPVPESV